MQGMYSHMPHRRNESNEPAVRIGGVFLIFCSILTGSLVGCGALTNSTGVDSRLPSIAEQPADQTVVASSPATFSVVASGTQPFSFQWEKNGSPILGATLASYTTPATTASDNGARFTVVVGDSIGTVVSRTARLTVTAPGQISDTPSSLNFGNVLVGSTASRQITLFTSGGSDVTLSKICVTGPGFDVSGASAGLVQSPGQATTLVVTFSPAASGSVTGSISITSDASNPLTVIYLSGSGLQPVAHSVSLTISVPAGSDVVGYNIYRASISGGPYAKLTQSLNTTTSFTDVTVQAGDTYYYVATSVGSSNMESQPSDEVSATIPVI
jgi:hypothetical protein